MNTFQTLKTELGALSKGGEMGDTLGRYTYVSFVTVCVISAFVYIWRIMDNKKNWTKESSDKSLEARRGTFTSVFAMLTLGILNMTMDKYAGINGTTSAGTMSMMVGNMTGFVMDAALASHEGWSKSEGGLTGDLSKSFQHGFASILSMNFVRYILTVLMDFHISSVFVEGIKHVPFFETLEKNKDWKTFLPTFFATIVSLTTFYAYTNESRFRFALRKQEDDVASEKNYVDSFSFFTFVSIAACMYLHTKVDNNQGIHKPNMKVLTSLTAFALMVLMSMSNSIESPGQLSGDHVHWAGFAAFTSIVVAMTVATFQTGSAGELARKNRIGMIAVTVLTILIPLLIAMELGTERNGVVALCVFFVLFLLSMGVYRKLNTTKAS